MLIEEKQKHGLDLLLDAHGLDPLGHFFISESLRHIQDEKKLHKVEFVLAMVGKVKNHLDYETVFDQQPSDSCQSLIDKRLVG